MRYEISEKSKKLKPVLEDLIRWSLEQAE